MTLPTVSYVLQGCETGQNFPLCFFPLAEKLSAVGTGKGAVWARLEGKLCDFGKMWLDILGKTISKDMHLTARSLAPTRAEEQRLQ